MLNLNKKILIPSLILVVEIVRSEKSAKYFNFDNLGGKLEILAKDIKMKTLTIQFKLKILLKISPFCIPKIQEEEYFKKEKYKVYYKIINNNKKLLYESELFTDEGKFYVVQIPLIDLNSNFSISFFYYKKKILNNINTTADYLVEENKQNKKNFEKEITKKEILRIYNYSLKNMK